MKKALFLVASTALFATPASAAVFMDQQQQTVSGEDFTFVFNGMDAPSGDGVLEFLIRGDFTIGASLGESFDFDFEGIATGSDFQATNANLIESFNSNDNLFAVSVPISLAELISITADGVGTLNVDYASGVNIIEPESSIKVTLTYPAVPEPATWLMLILGFGLIGGTMRHANRVRKTTLSYS